MDDVAACQKEIRRLRAVVRNLEGEIENLESSQIIEKEDREIISFDDISRNSIEGKMLRISLEMLMYQSEYENKKPTEIIEIVLKKVEELSN